MLTLWSAAAGCNNRMPMCIGSFSLHSKWIGLSKRYPNSSVLRRDVESDRLIGNSSVLPLWPWDDMLQAKGQTQPIVLGVILERYTVFTSVKRMIWSRTWEGSEILRSEDRSWKTEINRSAEQRDWNKQTASRFGKDTKEGYCFAITRNTLAICCKSIQSTLATS